MPVTPLTHTASSLTCPPSGTVALVNAGAEIRRTVRRPAENAQRRRILSKEAKAALAHQSSPRSVHWLTNAAPGFPTVMRCRGMPRHAERIHSGIEDGAQVRAPPVPRRAGRSRARTLPRRAEHQGPSGRGGPCTPLAFTITAGQAGDAPGFEAVMARIRVPRTGPGRPRTRPTAVLAARAYSSRAIRGTERRRAVRDAALRPRSMPYAHGSIRPLVRVHPGRRGYSVASPPEQTAERSRR
jgi:hypothetical protein